MSLSALGLKIASLSGSDSISLSISVSGFGSSPVEGGGPPSFRFHRWTGHLTTANIDLHGCATLVP